MTKIAEPPSKDQDKEAAQMALPEYLELQRRRVDARLEQLVPPESARPSLIHRAMRYSLFAGGKRLRPALCLESARLFASELSADAEAVSCTLELVHTYSLIHDDLPALDNDDYRRGKLTCHKVFGDAIAILAGDALLTLSFQVLSTLPNTPAEVRSGLAAELSKAAGTVDGMIGGQVVDLEAVKEQPAPEMLEYIHRSKTAALIRAAVCMGGIAQQAAPEQMGWLHEFGGKAGLAFQIADDILDVESSSEVLGKTAGKDAEQKKVTYPALYGTERSRQMAADWIGQAKAALEPFGGRAARLKEIADFLVFRKA